MADGTTKYLSELGAGDAVAICDSNGVVDEAVVGRMKIDLDRSSIRAKRNLQLDKPLFSRLKQCA